METYFIERRGTTTNAISLSSKLYNDEFTIFIEGEISAESMQETRRQLMCLHNKDTHRDITIYIDSPGGEVFEGMATIDLIQQLQAEGIKINTIVTANACSMGALLLVSGTKGCRAAYKNARIMIHNPSINSVSGNALAVKNISDRLMQTRKLTAKFIADATGKTIEQIYEDTIENCYFTAEEALEYGLIDKIL